MVSKIPAVKVEQSKKSSFLVLKRTVFSIVQIWRLVFLEPLGVQRRYVPDFKGLIYVKVEPEAQGRDSTFTFCHAHLKKAILHLKWLFSTATTASETGRTADPLVLWPEGGLRGYINCLWGLVRPSWPFGQVYTAEREFSAKQWFCTAERKTAIAPKVVGQIQRYFGHLMYSWGVLFGAL